MRFVQARALESNMVLARDIVNTRNAFMLRAGMKLTEQLILRLQKSGYLGAYVQDEFSSGIEMNEMVDPETFKRGMEALQGDNISGMMNVARDLVEDVSSRRELRVDLIDLRSYDDYTYHHSMNVAVYAVVVGKKMGLSEADLNLLSQAAVCHDLGKLKIPETILNKKGKLTDEEYKMVQMHPKYSFDMLHDKMDISSVVRQAVLYHHENENGSGYPYGRAGDEIPLMAKIIHAVDVYDALTSKRPYKNPYSPVDAFEYMISGRNILFNADVVDAMASVIPAYPPGLTVALSNGQTGVIAAQTKNPMRPIVRLFDTRENVNLSTDPRYAKVFITKSANEVEDEKTEITPLNEDRTGHTKKTKDVVLVVDDQPVSIMQTKAALGNEYEIVSFRSGIEAVHYVSTHDCPSLVIMDVNLPLMDGVRTVKTMQENGGFHAPVIFLTSAGDRDTVIRCRSVGAVDYIVKPAKPVYLKERVEIALKKSME